MAQLYTSKYGEEFCVDGDKTCIKTYCNNCGTIWVREGVPHVCNGGTLTATLLGFGGRKEWWKHKEVKKCGDENGM